MISSDTLNIVTNSNDVVSHKLTHGPVIRNLKILTCFFIITLFQPLYANEILEYKEKLIELGKIDQQSRSDNLYWDEQIKLDKSNLKQLKELINKFGFPTIDKVGKKAHISAFLMAQHAVNDREFMKFYLKETELRLHTGAIINKTYVYLIDRINELSGKKQIYGTQGQCVNGEYKLSSQVEDINNIENLRKKIGLLSLNDFSKQACTH